MIFVNPDHGSRLSEALVHAVCPSAVSMLEMLNNLQLQVHVHLISNLETVGTGTAATGPRLPQ